MELNENYKSIGRRFTTWKKQSAKNGYGYTVISRQYSRNGHKARMGSAWLVYEELLENFNDELGYSFPSFEKISQDTGISIRSVHNHVEKLKELGYIYTQEAYARQKDGQFGREQNNMYVLVPLDEVEKKYSIKAQKEIKKEQRQEKQPLVAVACEEEPEEQHIEKVPQKNKSKKNNQKQRTIHQNTSPETAEKIFNIYGVFFHHDRFHIKTKIDVMGDTTETATNIASKIGTQEYTDRVVNFAKEFGVTSAKNCGNWFLTSHKEELEARAELESCFGSDFFKNTPQKGVPQE